jgi:hypothetical protein
MRWTLCACLLLALAPEPADASEKVRVAVAKVRGRRAAKPDRLENGIKNGISQSGAQPIASGALAKAARGVGVKANSAEGARAASADYLVTVKLSLRRKKFNAAVELIRASDGEVVERMERTFAGRGALAAGRAIGKRLGSKAVELGRPEAVAEAPPTRVIEPPPPERALEPPPPVASGIEPKEDEDDEVTAKTEIEPSSGKRSGREDGYLRASLAGGSQLASAYTVVVGGEPTGLAYSLTPLFLANANVVVRIPQIGLFFGARVDFAPVKYQIDVDPPVDPAEPTGQFLSAGGTIGYEVLDLDLTESVRLRLSPMVGIGWDSLSVQSQGDNTIVLSWSAINANGGLDVSLILFDSLVIAAEGRGGYVFSYSEKPTTTGEGGSGVDVLGGLSVRYWLIDLFGIYLDATYEYMRIGMSGEGTRVRFMEDDPIVDAAIFSADFKVGLGVMIGI